MNELPVPPLIEVTVGTGGGIVSVGALPDRVYTAEELGDAFPALSQKIARKFVTAAVE